MNRMLRGLPAGEVGQPDQALDAADDGEEKRERDPDPVVDGPHQVRIQGSHRDYAAIEPGRGSDSSSLTVRSGCRASSRTVAQPILRRYSARNAKRRTVVM